MVDTHHMPLELEPHRARVRARIPFPFMEGGHVVGLTIEASGASHADWGRVLCGCLGGSESIPLEVVGFRGRRILLMPLGEIRELRGQPDEAFLQPLSVRVNEDLLGRVIDSRGTPIDGGRRLRMAAVLLTASAPRPLDRQRIVEPVATGIRAVDAW